MTGTFALPLALALAVSTAQAEEKIADSEDLGRIQPGETIVAGNIDELLEKKFKGERLGDLLPEKVEWQIRNTGLRVGLRDTQRYHIDRHYAARNERNKETVSFDPETRRPVGWVAGVPFPSIDPSDPHAGWKVAWNQAYGPMNGDSINRELFIWILIDGQNGIERLQHWNFRRIRMAGRYGAASEGPTLGDGTIHFKQIFFGLAPQDLKGIGTFTIRYTTGAFDDSWAYIRDLRRVRRLSGGAWMNPAGSTDWLNDDIDVLAAFPTWYKDFRLVGKKKILVHGSVRSEPWIEGAEDINQRFPHLNLETAPYWYPNEPWEVREALIVKAIPPEEHPYSEKIAYIDPEIWLGTHGEAYDDAGVFKKWMYQPVLHHVPADDPNGHAYWGAYGGAIDFQNFHATIFVGSPQTTFNGPMTPDEISLGVLEAQGQ